MAATLAVQDRGRGFVSGPDLGRRERRVALQQDLDIRGAGTAGRANDAGGERLKTGRLACRLGSASN